MIIKHTLPESHLMGKGCAIYLNSHHRAYDIGHVNSYGHDSHHRYGLGLYHGHVPVHGNLYHPVYCHGNSHNHL